jgi:pilus assembly protein CpaB
MKGKTMVLMAVAVGFGLVAAFLTTQMTARPPAPKVTKVVVANKKVERGLKITDPNQFFMLKEVPETAVPKSALTNLEAIKDKIPNRIIAPDSYVTLEDFVAETGPKLEKGQRAVAIRVDQEKTAGGFVMPNRRVDIILTERDQQGNPISKTLMTNMLVLAVDQLLGPEEGKSSKIPTTVTLAVTPRQAERLAAAREKGQLSLALRPPEEDSAKSTDEGLDEDNSIEIVVAKEDIPKDRELDESLLDKKLFPKTATLPANVIKVMSELKGKTVNRKIAKDSYITQDDLVVVKESPKKEPVVKKSSPTYVGRLVIYNGPRPQIYDWRQGPKGYFAAKVDESDREEDGMESATTPLRLPPPSEGP